MHTSLTESYNAYFLHVNRFTSQLFYKIDSSKAKAIGTTFSLQTCKRLIIGTVFVLQTCKRLALSSMSPSGLSSSYRVQGNQLLHVMSISLKKLSCFTLSPKQISLEHCTYIHLSDNFVKTNKHKEPSGIWPHRTYTVTCGSSFHSTPHQSLV